MKRSWTIVIGWVHTALASLVPWIGLKAMAWVPATLVVLVVLQRPAVRNRYGEPWRSLTIALSAFVALGMAGGWLVACSWMALAGVTAALAAAVPELRGVARPDTIDLGVAVVGATAFALQPQLLTASGGGWIAPVLLFVASRRAVVVWASQRSGQSMDFGPPDREVRGTLSFFGAVADEHGLLRTSPIDLEVRAGSSIAILCDDQQEAADLAETLCGRRLPAKGQLSVDGVPLQPGDRLVAVVAMGEVFLSGGLDENLEIFSDDALPAGARAAVFEACSLSEVEDSLNGRFLEVDGRPLCLLHRFLVQAARVLVSHYRIVVVLDPMPWVNPIRAELWRSAVVRASVGRTAVWLTADRSLATRADRVLELRHGTLKEA